MAVQLAVIQRYIGCQSTVNWLSHPTAIWLFSHIVAIERSFRYHPMVIWLYGHIAVIQNGHSVVTH